MVFLAEGEERATTSIERSPASQGLGECSGAKSLDYTANYMQNIFEKIGLVAAIILPLWNIPLIIKIIKRRSSGDISLAWVIGIWVCIVLMAPSGFQSKDVVWRAFNIMNFILFTAVFVTVLKYRKGKS